MYGEGFENVGSDLFPDVRAGAWRKFSRPKTLTCFSTLTASCYSTFIIEVGPHPVIVV